MQNNPTPPVFDPEIISGLRAKQLDLLHAVEAICKKHDIQYWLDFGTLLGAKREGTFIPWDDDIDISMPMDDYKKFLSIAPSELPAQMLLQTSSNDPEYKQCYAKIRDLNSTFLSAHNERTSHYGIYIDIFPSYEYPLMPYKLRKIFLYITGRSYASAFVTEKYRLINALAYYFMKVIWFFLRPLSNKTYGQTPEDNWYYYAVPAKYIFPLETIHFADGIYPAPRNPHEYLTVMYGDYMTPPPVDQQKREVHAKLILPNVSYEEYTKRAQPD